jgi:hypothetical protein
MRKTTAFAAALGLSLLAGSAGASAGAGAEDDLAVVKRAVASPVPAASRAPKTEPSVVAQAEAVPPPARSAPEARPAPRPGREPQWFKVRVVDKASGRRKVTINLPLSLVRALGDETVDIGCHHAGERERCHDIRLSEVLRSLEAGQELVEIEDDEATVKVWVE